MWVKVIGEGPKTEKFQSKQFYCVYGIGVRDSLELILCGDTYEIPTGYPADHFEVVDPRLSRTWVIGPAEHRKTAAGANFTSYLMTFPEWALTKFFYDNFVNGVGESSAVFRRYKHFMELEFARPDVIDEAVTSKDIGMQCVNCFNIWEPSKGTELIVCPECKRLQRLPSNLLEGMRVTSD